MSFTSLESESCGHQTRSGVFFPKAASQGSTSRPKQPQHFVLTCAIFWSYFLQLSHSSVDTKKPILIYSIFSQPDKPTPFLTYGSLCSLNFQQPHKDPFELLRTPSPSTKDNQPYEHLHCRSGSFRFQTF